MRTSHSVESVEEGENVGVRISLKGRWGGRKREAERRRGGEAA